MTSETDVGRIVWAPWLVGASVMDISQTSKASGHKHVISQSPSVQPAYHSIGTRLARSHTGFMLIVFDHVGDSYTFQESVAWFAVQATRHDVSFSRLHIYSVVGYKRCRPSKCTYEPAMRGDCNTPNGVRFDCWAYGRPRYLV